MNDNGVVEVFEHAMMFGDGRGPRQVPSHLPTHAGHIARGTCGWPAFRRFTLVASLADVQCYVPEGLGRRAQRPGMSRARVRSSASEGWKHHALSTTATSGATQFLINTAAFRNVAHVPSHALGNASLQACRNVPLTER